MGFYNVQQGDRPFFKRLADRYTISDNYHQPAWGGTGLDSIIASFGDALWYSDGNGNVATRPSNQIENPDPQSGTNRGKLQLALHPKDGASLEDSVQWHWPNIHHP
jgi:phospholipase C